MIKDFGPEIMAAVVERAEKSGISTENVEKAVVAAKKMGFKPLGLKDLIGQTRSHRSNDEVGYSLLESSVPSFHGYERALVSCTLALFSKSKGEYL